MTRPSAGPGFSTRRVFAMVERHLYLLGASPVRILDLVYWPTVQLLTWSFLQLYVGAPRNCRCSRRAR